MKIIIQGTKLDLTPSLKKYVEEKLGTLRKFLKRWNAESLTLRVEIARSTRHHLKGEVFYAEANLDIPGGVLRAEAYHRDARLAVNEVKRTLEREIAKRKGKREARKRK